MNLLIIGGNKFVGKALVEKAVSLGHDVTVLSLDPPPMLQYVRWLKENRDNTESIKGKIKGEFFDVLIDNISYRPEHVLKTISAFGNNIGKYILTSTVDVYGTVKIGSPVPTILDPTTTKTEYGKNKYRCEQALRTANISAEKIIVRPSIVYGLHDNIIPNNEIISRSLWYPARAIDGFPILISDERLGIPFNLVHVDDLADAFMLLAEKSGLTNKIFNVSNSEILTLEKLVRTNIDYCGRDTEIIKVSEHTIEAPAYHFGKRNSNSWNIYDTSDIIDLGWTPKNYSDHVGSLYENIKISSKKIQDKRQSEILTALQKFTPFKLYPLSFIKQSQLSSTTPSNIGIGTHIGASSLEDDQRYHDAITFCKENKINVIDTAINYRNQRSEAVVGNFISTVDRSKIFLISKGGYAVDPLRQFLTEDEKRFRGHSIRHTYIGHSLSHSLANLKTKIDCYLLHNVELGKQIYSDDIFYNNLLLTFILLERKVEEGLIGSYGIATWDGLRVNSDHKLWLDMNRVLKCAEIAAGTNRTHNFKSIELPLNPVKHEAFTEKNQLLDNKPVTILEFAKSKNLNIFTSDSAMRGEATIPFGQLNSIQASINFSRSAPGVTTALVGMRRKSHVEQAIKLLNANKFTQDEMFKLIELYKNEKL